MLRGERGTRVNTRLTRKTVIFCNRDKIEYSLPRLIVCVLSAPPVLKETFFFIVG